MDIQIIWDLEDDPDGNVQHIAEHDLTLEEVSEVLIENIDRATVSRATDAPATFGWTSTGRHIIVIFEHVDDDPVTVRPVTAYDVPPPREKRRRRK